LLTAILTAEPEVFGGVAGLLKPGGKLTVVLSVVETDSVDGVRRLEDRTVAALCQRISGVCPDLTDHTYRTATAAGRCCRALDVGQASARRTVSTGVAARVRQALHR
jgi:hypothetical protein